MEMEGDSSASAEREGLSNAQSVAASAREKRRAQRSARRAAARDNLEKRKQGLVNEDEEVAKELQMQGENETLSSLEEGKDELSLNGNDDGEAPKLLAQPMSLGETTSEDDDDGNDWMIRGVMKLKGARRTHFSGDGVGPMPKLLDVEQIKSLEEQRRKEVKRAAKKEQQAQKKEEIAEKLSEMENSKVAQCNISVQRSSTEQGSGSDSVCLQLEGLSMDYGGKVRLLDDVTLRLVTGRKYGIVGRNGCGKTTLLKHLPELCPKNLVVLSVAQEAQPSSTLTALQSVLEADEERTKLLEREKALLRNIESGSTKSPEEIKEMEKVQGELEAIGASSAEARARSILSGLGFSEQMQNMTTDQLSGGWRMRLALARALYLEPHLLLLDEPSNHLDLYAVIWLEGYLRRWTSTLVVVSHDAAFLDNVATDIIHISHISKKLMMYKGNYSAYMEQRRQMYIAQERAYIKQQEEIAHMQAFVDKWLHNRFGNNRGLVQSRLKFIERKKTVEKIEKPLPLDEQVKFSFRDPEDAIPNPLIQVKDVSFRYPGTEKDLFKDVTIRVENGAKIAMVGANGVGKSTFLKLLTQELDPTEGAVVIRSKVRMGVFSQHFVQQLDLNLCPLEEMRMACGVKPSEQDLRSRLGAFGVGPILAESKIKKLSGGQKSRVAFAKLAVGDPHVLILDEPTNHQDIETIGGLVEAINSFSGAVIFVSHDSRLINSCANQLFHVDGKGSVEQLYCTFREYRQKISDQFFESS